MMVGALVLPHKKGGMMVSTYRLLGADNLTVIPFSATMMVEILVLPNLMHGMMDLSAMHRQNHTLVTFSAIMLVGWLMLPPGMSSIMEWSTRQRRPLWPP